MPQMLERSGPQLNRLRALMQKLVQLKAQLSDCLEQNNEALRIAQTLPMDRTSNAIANANTMLQRELRNVAEYSEVTRRNLKLEYEKHTQNDLPLSAKLAD